MVWSAVIGSCPTCTPVTSRLLYGSVSGPVLFNIFISDPVYMRQCISTRSAGDTKLGGRADTCKDIQRELVRPEKQPVRNILQFNTPGGPSRQQAEQEPAVCSGNDGSQWAALRKSRKVIITPYLALFRHICNTASSFRAPTLKKSVNELK